MDYRQLNNIYEILDKRAREICDVLHCSFGYYNGHYHKNLHGNYEIEYYPIPVIGINGLCDIEIGLNQISITTKLTRDKAVSYDYDKVKEYCFEAYGVENYLDDFFLAGDTIESMVGKISNSKEKNIFFSFFFPNDVKASVVCELVKLIDKEGFFY